MKTTGLPIGHIDNVCQIGKGSITCSFLVSGPDGFFCAKGSNLEDLIYRRKIEGSIRAMGDNCSGPEDNFNPFI